MRDKKVAFMCALIAAASLPIWAATPSEKPPVVSVQPVQMVVLTPGTTASAVIIVVVAKGYHVQANPPSEDYLIATKLSTELRSAIKVGEAVYPKSVPHRLEGSKDALATYEGTFEVRLPITADPGSTLGTTALKGSLRYQACDARSCLAPASLPVEIPLKVAAKETH